MSGRALRRSWGIDDDQRPVRVCGKNVGRLEFELDSSSEQKAATISIGAKLGESRGSRRAGHEQVVFVSEVLLIEETGEFEEERRVARIEWEMRECDFERARRFDDFCGDRG